MSDTAKALEAAAEAVRQYPANYPRSTAYARAAVLAFLRAMPSSRWVGDPVFMSLHNWTRDDMIAAIKKGDGG